MGADQSTGRNTGAQPVPVATKTCYYELLGLDQQAADDEIRRAYKRKALELHPDRNLGDIENATRKFAEVQTAYEILSDPQERAWYDSHRDAILSGADPEASGPSPAEQSPSRYTPATRIFDLMGRFRSTVPMNDTPSGFFGVLNLFFDQLAMEETDACDRDGISPVVYPPLGLSNDSYDDVARLFYQVWAGFSTKKSFGWRDKYRLSDAPDRRIRRLMEKENRKLRDEGIREFNDAVTSLVAFVKKRDPRYVPNTQSEAERQQILRNSAAAQAARSRAANQEKLANFVIPDWAQSQGGQDFQDEFPLSEVESEVEHIQCVVCNKTFKSEKQYEAHEKSKKHIKAVQELRRQMRREDAGFDLHAADQQQDSHEAPRFSPHGSLQVDKGQDGNATYKLQPQPAYVSQPGSPSVDSRVADASSDDSNDDKNDQKGGGDEEGGVGDDDDSYAPRSQVEGRLRSVGDASKSTTAQDNPRVGEALGVDIDEVSIQASDGAKKIGKAKKKREKKAARLVVESENGHTCTFCNESFASRSKLFTHIKELGHAAPVPQQLKGSKKNKR